MNPVKRTQKARAIRRVAPGPPRRATRFLRSLDRDRVRTIARGATNQSVGCAEVPVRARTFPRCARMVGVTRVPGGFGGFGVWRHPHTGSNHAAAAVNYSRAASNNDRTG